jgi:hypothetical protein
MCCLTYVRAHARRAPMSRARELICSHHERPSCSCDGIESAQSSSVRHRPSGHQRPVAGGFAGELVEVEWLVLVLVAQAKYQCGGAHERWE